MIRLTIGNSTCRLEGLPREKFDEIRRATSYTESTKNRFGFQDVTKNLMDRKGSFPTGLLYLVEEQLRAIPHSINDTRVKPSADPKFPAIQLGSLEPYPEQLEAAAAVAEYERGIICAPTGVGKSVIAALIAFTLGVPTLIVVPSLELKKQLTIGLRALFGASHVGPLGRDGRPLNFLTVENVDALPSKRLQKGIDLVIIDEFHHSGAKTYRDLNQHAWQDVYYKVGLTATPFRSKDTERLLLESVLSKVIYKIDYETAVSKGYIVPLEVYYYDLPKLKLKCNGKSWAGVYSELVVKREDRNRLIAHLTANLVESHASTLVLVKQIDHGESLQDLITSLLGKPFPFIKGENDNNREKILEFNLREEIGTLGTSGVLGEGVDTKPAEYVVLAGGGKSKNAFMQQCGRVFRVYNGKESGKIILFRDRSHQWLLEHFRAQCRYLKDEYGVIPTKLDLPEELA